MTRLEEAMHLRGRSQADVVRATGISPVMVYHYVQGRNKPNYINAKYIAQYLQVELDWLMGGDGPMEEPADERYLIQAFRSLNDDGKAKLLSYVDDLVNNPKNLI